MSEPRTPEAALLPARPAPLTQHAPRRGRRARRLAGLAALVASGSIVASACSSSAVAGTVVTVHVLDASSAYPQGRFDPARVVARPGTKVVWVMDTGAVDSVTGDDGMWGSGLLHHGQSYVVRFNRPGTYRYHDVVHFLTGLVVVR